MRPGAVGTFPKVVPPQGEVVQGKFIPGGTVVGMNVPAMLRSTEHFGSDADLFRPERWMEASGPQRGEMERQVETAFGHGRWMCAGKPIAFMELFKTFFEVRLGISVSVSSGFSFYDDCVADLCVLFDSCFATSTLLLLTRLSLGIQYATMSSSRTTCGSKSQRQLSL